jgi:biotin carboxyl carrier protein
MAYIVRCNGREFTIDLQKAQSGETADSYRVNIKEGDDQEEYYTLDVSHITPTHLSILWDNRSFNVEVEKIGDEYLVSTRGEVFNFRVHDERSAAPEVEDDSGESLVTAPMPGLVVKLLVKPGDVVDSKDKLLVLEAMKMQNDLTAPCSGTVTEVFVSEGDSVMTGDELVRVESSESETGEE